WEIRFPLVFQSITDIAKTNTAQNAQLKISPLKQFMPYISINPNTVKRMGIIFYCVPFIAKVIKIKSIKPSTIFTQDLKTKIGWVFGNLLITSSLKMGIEFVGPCKVAPIEKMDSQRSISIEIVLVRKRKSSSEP